jgi:hypothetical protein
MAMDDWTIGRQFLTIVSSGRADRREKLKEAFLEVFPPRYNGKEIFREAAETFKDKELAEICAKLFLAATHQCSAEDFMSWKREHIEFILSMADTYDFTLP